MLNKDNNNVEVVDLKETEVFGFLKNIFQKRSLKFNENGVTPELQKLVDAGVVSLGSKVEPFDLDGDIQAQIKDALKGISFK